MANFFANLIGSGASNLIDSIGDAINKNVTTDQERLELSNELAKAQQQHELDMATLGVRETEAYLGDTADARANQSRVQETANASWLAKNIQPMLAVAIIALTFFLYWNIIFSGDSVLAKRPEMKDIIIYILGALTTVSTQVASYFFGSSQGSADKSKHLMTLMRGKQAGDS